MGYPHGTDHGLRDRRDEKLHRAVRVIESGPAASARGWREQGWGPASTEEVVASDTGRKREQSQCKTNLGSRVASGRRGTGRQPT